MRSIFTKINKEVKPTASNAPHVFVLLIRKLYIGKGRHVYCNTSLNILLHWKRFNVIVKDFMTYKFLYHLTQAALPMTIYDLCLVRQLKSYEDQRLIVTATLKLVGHATIPGADITQVTKITRAGRRTVRRYLNSQNAVESCY